MPLYNGGVNKRGRSLRELLLVCYASIWLLKIIFGTGRLLLSAQLYMFTYLAKPHFMPICYNMFIYALQAYMDGIYGAGIQKQKMIYQLLGLQKGKPLFRLR